MSSVLLLRVQTLRILYYIHAALRSNKIVHTTHSNAAFIFLLLLRMFTFPFNGATRAIDAGKCTHPICIYMGRGSSLFSLLFYITQFLITVTYFDFDSFTLAILVKINNSHFVFLSKAIEKKNIRPLICMQNRKNINKHGKVCFGF